MLMNSPGDAMVEVPADAAARTTPDAKAEADFAYHVHTYRKFVKYSALFAAHVLALLALLGYVLT
jgi:hypothetical protein